MQETFQAKLDLLDAHFDGTLPLQEVQEVEERLATDTDFKQLHGQVLLVRRYARKLKRMETIREIASNFEEKRPGRTFSPFRVKIRTSNLAKVASIALLVGTLIFFGLRWLAGEREGQMAAGSLERHKQFHTWMQEGGSFLPMPEAHEALPDTSQPSHEDSDKRPAPFKQHVIPFEPKQDAQLVNYDPNWMQTEASSKIWIRRLNGTSLPSWLETCQIELPFTGNEGLMRKLTVVQQMGKMPIQSDTDPQKAVGKVDLVWCVNPLQGSEVRYMLTEKSLFLFAKDQASPEETALLHLYGRLKNEVAPNFMEVQGDLFRLQVHSPRQSPLPLADKVSWDTLDSIQNLAPSQNQF